MVIPAAADKRFCCNSATIWLKEFALILDHHFAPLGYHVPTASLPDFLVRFTALFNQTVKNTLPYLGRYYSFSTERIQSVLGWKPRPEEDSIITMAQTLIDFGYIKKIGGKR